MTPKQVLAARQRAVRRRRWQRRLVIIGLVLLPLLSLLAGISVHLHQQGQRTPMERLVERVANWVVPPDYAFAGRDRLNILIVGADRDYDRQGRPLPTPARSDTILLVSFHRDGKAALLSIPRDTLVRYNGRLHKINAVHAMDGPEKLREVLEEQFGIEIHHFVQVTFDAFIKLVDLVGGVDMFVEHDLHYDDNWGKLHIHLQRGKHHLDGQKAIGYVRYRKGHRRYCPKCKVKIEHWDPTSDLGRVKRQQKFLKVLAKKLLRPSMVTKLPRLASIASQYLATDMSTKTMLSLANFARQLDLDAIKTTTLPGGFVRHHRLGSILIPDREKAPPLLTELLGPTFFASLWEQGEGSLGGALRVATRPAHASPQHRPSHAPQPKEPTEEQEMEGVPISQGPIEVTVIEPTPMNEFPPPEAPVSELPESEQNKPTEPAASPKPAPLEPPPPSPSSPSKPSKPSG